MRGKEDGEKREKGKRRREKSGHKGARLHEG